VRVDVFKNRFLWYAVGSSFILQVFVLYTPVVNRAFNVTVLESLDQAFAVLFAAITFATLETAKWVMSRRRKKQTA
jgi:magnesium-transporting ATPase (P-type)